MGWFTYLVFWSAIGLVIYKLYLKLTIGWCRSNVCLVGKTTIITGANTGIGYETALDFAKRGAKVILACRSDDKGTDVQEKIIKATGNKNIFFKKLDLASFRSVRDFAEDINETQERLDILVNNAGMVAAGDSKKSEDGLLTLMQANHFGPFLLTNLLLDLIKNTENSRIINVSSMGARYVGDFDVENLDKFDDAKAEFKLYVRSKLCNILFTIELANRLKGTGVTTYSVHPGAVSTDILKKDPTAVKLLLQAAILLFYKNTIEGAQTTIHCAVQKGIEDLSGEHFEDCHVVARYKTARNPDLPKKLWAKSEQVVKLNKIQ